MALPATADAQDAVSDHIGMLGFGYFTSDAPVGVRYWSSESLGFEGGIGFRSTNNNPFQENGSNDTTSLLNFAIEAGLLLVLNSDSNMILFVRPGFGFSSQQQIIADMSTDAAPGDQVKESATTFSVSGMIGVELFLTKLGFPNLSFGGGHGLVFSSASPAGDGDSTTTISTALANVNVLSDTNVGFHFYF
jgi:hypothetical protein